MNIFTRLTSFARRFRSGTRRDPVRDWLMLLALAGIVLAGIVIWNAWAFDTVASGGAIGSAAPGLPPIFDRAALNTIQTIFTDRAAEEAKYETGVYHYADPSQ